MANSSLNRWQKILARESGEEFIDVTEPLSVAPAALPSTREADEIWLYIPGVQWQARGTTINNTAESRSVALSEAGHRE